MNRLIAVLGTLAFVLGMTAMTAPAEAKRPRGHITLNDAGSKYVNAPFKIKGSVSSNTGRKVKRIVAQQYTGGQWVTRSTMRRRANGTYLMTIRIPRVGTARVRTALYVRGKRLDVSNTISVRIISAPSDGGGGTPPPPPPPPPAQQTPLEKCMNNPSATTCLDNVQDAPPANALLPDIRIRSFARCPASTGQYPAPENVCFNIINTDDTYSDDFPNLWFKKLLKFPVVTVNLGPGNAEIVADRSGDQTTWSAYQTFYTPDGKRTEVANSADFYFAGDGHNHWHVKDFDSYELYAGTDTTTAPVAVAEKHGYCLEDNLGPLPGVPFTKPTETYLHDKMCGYGLPAAVSIIHGLSTGWGDTYPRTLPDQGIDITGLPDGDYTLVAHADAKGNIVETNDDNNTASITVTIAGDTVTPHNETARGGYLDAN